MGPSYSLSIPKRKPIEKMELGSLLRCMVGECSSMETEKVLTGYKEGKKKNLYKDN